MKLFCYLFLIFLRLIDLQIWFYSESIKDPKLLLKKLKQEKEQISELVAQGEIEKADELKKNIAWQKAFDKTDGKKVE